MQCTIIKIQKEQYVLIYLTKEELKTLETQEKINEYKKQKCKLGKFVAGQENYPEILNKIVTKQMELSDYVCEHSNLIYKWFIKYIN